MTFGNFAHSNFGSSDVSDKSGSMPADIGLGNKGLHSLLVEQAWSISPANFQKQAATSDLPAAGYGSGARARIDSDAVTGPLPSFETIVSRSTANGTAARNVEGMTLRSVLSPVLPAGRINRPSDSAGQSFTDVATAPTPKPEPAKTELTGWAATGNLDKPFVPATAAPKPELLNPIARAEVVEPLKKPVEFDVKAHPLFANIKEGARSNQKVESTKAPDPFMADNCYQSMEISPDGKVTTTTTLPDLSASKIESRFPDKSTSIALTDHLGRPTLEHRFDASGKLVSETSSRFDHADSPMVPSHRVTKTASQTIETTMDKTGASIATKVMPYSDLDVNKVSA